MPITNRVRSSRKKVFILVPMPGAFGSRGILIFSALGFTSGVASGLGVFLIGFLGAMCAIGSQQYLLRSVLIICYLQKKLLLVGFNLQK